MLILLTSLLVILLDRLSKNWAQAALMGGKAKKVFSWLYFDYLENRGAAFGILQGKFILFTILTILVIFLLLRYYRAEKKQATPPLRRLLAVATGLIAGGGIGNLIDRLVRNYVVDFIVVDFFDNVQFPTFNVADIGVTTGAVLLLIYFIVAPSDEEEKKKETEDQ